MRIRKGMVSCIVVLGSLVALSCDDGVTTPPVPDDPVTPLLIVGEEMGTQFQSLTITRRGRTVTDAVVTVNGVTLPHTGGGSYQGQLPAALPAGSPLNLRVSAGRATVEGTREVPEAPVVTTPVTGTVFAPTDSITVAWTSATTPDRFVVVATTMLGEESFSQSFPAPTAARQMKIAARDFPALTELAIEVYAYNDGGLTGAADPASRMSIRSGASSNVVITRDAGPLLILADMGPLHHNIGVSQDGRDIADAVVTVNGIAIPRSIVGFYQGQVPEAVPAGSPLVLEVSAGGVTVKATGNLPEAPVLTGPATGAVFALTDSIAVTWTSATNPEGFVVAVGSVFPVFFSAPGVARELKIAAGGVGLIERNLIDVTALNSGSFTGRSDPESRMNVWNRGIQNTLITIRN